MAIWKNIYEITTAGGQTIQLGGPTAQIDGNKINVQPDLDALSAALLVQINDNIIDINTLSGIIGNLEQGTNYNAATSGEIGSHFDAIDDKFGEMLQGEKFYISHLTYLSDVPTTLLKGFSTGTIVNEVMLSVDEAFDSQSTLTIGTSADNSLLADNTVFDLSTVTNQPQKSVLQNELLTLNDINAYISGDTSYTGSVYVILKTFIESQNTNTNSSNLIVDALSGSKLSNFKVPSSSAVENTIYLFDGYGCMKKNTGQTLNTTDTELNFDEGIIENNLIVTLVNNEFEILESGMYKITINAAGSYDESHISVGIKKNGISIATSSDTLSSTSDNTGEYPINIDISHSQVLLAGDKITFYGLKQSVNGVSRISNAIANIERI